MTSSSDWYHFPLKFFSCWERDNSPKKPNQGKGGMVNQLKSTITNSSHCNQMLVRRRILLVKQNTFRQHFRPLDLIFSHNCFKKLRNILRSLHLRIQKPPPSLLRPPPSHSLVMEKSCASTALTVAWFLLQSGVPNTPLELQNVSKNHLNWLQKLLKSLSDMIILMRF